MLPSLTVQEKTYRRNGHVVVFGQFVLVAFSFLVNFPYFRHQFLGQFGLRHLSSVTNLVRVLTKIVVVSSCSFVPSLCAHVMAVFFVISEEQMFRSNAQPIVAVVENEWSFEVDFSDLRQVAQTMRLDLLSPEVESAVSSSPYTSSPHPTFPQFRHVPWCVSVFVYLTPKSFVFFLGEVDCLVVGDKFNLVLRAHASSWVRGSSGPCPAPAGRGCAPILATPNSIARRIV